MIIKSLSEFEVSEYFAVPLFFKSELFYPGRKDSINLGYLKRINFSRTIREFDGLNFKTFSVSSSFLKLFYCFLENSIDTSFDHLFEVVELYCCS